MRIDPTKCVGCANCVAVCPMGAISVDARSRRAVVDPDACVECYTCYRGMSTERLNPTLVRLTRRVLEVFRLRFDPELDVCPTSAIVPEELTRSIPPAQPSASVARAPKTNAGKLRDKAWPLSALIWRKISASLIRMTTSSGVTPSVGFHHRVGRQE